MSNLKMICHRSAMRKPDKEEEKNHEVPEHVHFQTAVDS